MGRLSAVTVKDFLDLVLAREPVDVHADEHLTILQPAGELLEVRIAVRGAGKSSDERADRSPRARPDESWKSRTSSDECQ